MSKNRNAALCAALLAAAGAFLSADASAQAQSPRVAAATAGRERESFARLVDSTKGLHQALKRVSEQKKVDNAVLIAKNEQKIRAAEAAAADGKSAEARLALEEAYIDSKLAIVAAMKDGAPVPAPKAAADGANAKRQKDYAARMESTKSLRDALARIADEKNDASAKAEVATIDRLVGQADGLVAQGSADRGRAVLDHAYLRAKVQIERLRGGETLVRALQFDSKEDEYRYEFDRNDTFKMLVPLLVPDGRGDEARLKGFAERAGRLRIEAEEKAGRGDFDGAIKAMEDSSGELQKAIRSAGVLLPG